MAYTVRPVQIIMACLIGITLGEMMFNDVQKTDEVDVHMVHHGRSRRDNNRIMPHALDFNIKSNNGKVKTLRLKRSTASEIPTVRVTSGAETEDYTKRLEKVRETFAHYQDVENGAAIMLKRSADNPHDYHAFGSYFDGEDKYAIESTFKKRSTGEVIHETGLLEIPEDGGVQKTFDAVPNQQKSRPPLAPLPPIPFSSDSPPVLAAKIEAAYYIGTTEYDYLQNQEFVQNFNRVINFGDLINTTAITGAASFNTVAFLVFYVGYLNNEVDLKLQGFGDDAFVQASGNYSLGITYSYLHIFATEPPGASNTTIFWEHSVESNGRLTSANFYMYKDALAYDFGYDLHIGVTRETWSENATDPGLVTQARPQDPRNLAFCGDTSSICGTDKNFCVASDVPGESLVITLTRVVAISMGATFSEMKTCKDPDDVLNEMNETSSIGFSKFSECDFQEMLPIVFVAFAIPSSAVECLTFFNGGSEQRVMVFGGFAGQELNGDKQCELAIGPDAAVSRTHYQSLGSYISICDVGLVCVDDTGEKTKIPTLDGTQCGTGKICKRGACEESSDAMDNVLDTCPFGNDPQTDCAQADCTDTFTRLFLCCESCANEDESSSSSSSSSEEYAWIPGPHPPPNQDLPNGPFPGAHHTNMVKGPHGRKYFFSYIF